MAKKQASVTKTQRQSSAGKTKAPAGKAVASELGTAQATWNAIIANLTERYGEIDIEWKASKQIFGWVCLLKHKQRTLLYLTPEKEKILIGIVLGERSVALALAGELPHELKKLISEAPKYAEGRGFRFYVSAEEEAFTVTDLVMIKTTPK
jgi:uncharacterized protein DUF3788